MGGRGNPAGTLDHAAQHDFQPVIPRPLDHPPGLARPTRFHQLDIDPVIGPRQLRNIRTVHHILIREQRQRRPLPQPRHLLQPSRRQRLFDQLHPLPRQTHNVPQRRLRVLPALIRIHPQRLIRHFTHRIHDRLIAVRAQLDLQNRVVPRRQHLRPDRVQIVNPDAETGHRRHSLRDTQDGPGRKSALLALEIQQSHIQRRLG